MTRSCYWTRRLQGAASARLSLCSFWLFGMTISFSAAQTVPAVDVSELSLDTLASTEITSVSRKSQHLFQAAAAVFVITQKTFGVPDLIAFQKHCVWSPDSMWRRSTQTSGLLRRGDSTSASPTKC